MMKISLYLTNIINKHFKTNSNILLGRWKIEHCNNKINKKIDLSNQDHGYYNKPINHDVRNIIFYETI